MSDGSTRLCYFHASIKSGTVVTTWISSNVLLFSSTWIEFERWWQLNILPYECSNLCVPVRFTRGLSSFTAISNPIPTVYVCLNKCICEISDINWVESNRKTQSVVWLISGIMRKDAVVYYKYIASSIGLCYIAIWSGILAQFSE